MEYHLGLIFVGPQQFFPIAVGIVLWVGLAGLGLLFTGKYRLTEINILYGWQSHQLSSHSVVCFSGAPFL